MTTKRGQTKTTTGHPSQGKVREEARTTAGPGPGPADPGRPSQQAPNPDLTLATYLQSQQLPLIPQVLAPPLTSLTHLQSLILQLLSPQQEIMFSVTMPIVKRAPAAILENYRAQMLLTRVLGSLASIQFQKAPTLIALMELLQSVATLSKSCQPPMQQMAQA